MVNAEDVFDASFNHIHRVADAVAFGDSTKCGCGETVGLAACNVRTRGGRSGRVGAERSLRDQDAWAMVASLSVRTEARPFRALRA